MKWDLFIIAVIGFVAITFSQGKKKAPKDIAKHPDLPDPKPSRPRPPDRWVTSEEYNILITDKFYRACSAHKAHIKKFGYESDWFAYECNRGTGILPWKEVLARNAIVASPKTPDPTTNIIPPATTNPSPDGLSRDHGTKPVEPIMILHH